MTSDRPIHRTTLVLGLGLTGALLAVGFLTLFEGGILTLLLSAVLALVLTFSRRDVAVAAIWAVPLGVVCGVALWYITFRLVFR